MKNDWTYIATLQDIPKQGSRVVETKSGNIALFRTQSDQVFALKDRCPHKGGPLSQGIVHGEKVACPLHGWVIDLDSGQAIAPDVGCTQRFKVKIENNQVFIEL